jgi:hypothetical protein
MEIIAGTVGLLVHIWAVSQQPQSFPAWHNTLAVLFFGGNVVAGYLVRQRRPSGFKASFFLQLMQVLVLNFGTKVVFRAGVDLSAVLASTGAGLFGGPESALALFPSTVGGFAASGLGYELTIGWWIHPVQEARWAIGVNFVALYFARRLWVAITTPAEVTMLSAPALLVPAPAPIPPRRAARPWVLRVLVSGVAIIALWMAVGSPQFGGGTYARHWPLATGDTVEILRYVKQYHVNYVLNQGGVQADRYLWLQFRSALQDTARDHANAVAAAALVCPEAVRLGIRRVLVEPTKNDGVMTYTHEYWFQSDSGSNCQEGVGK